MSFDDELAKLAAKADAEASKNCEAAARLDDAIREALQVCRNFAAQLGPRLPPKPILYARKRWPKAAWEDAGLRGWFLSPSGPGQPGFSVTTDGALLCAEQPEMHCARRDVDRQMSEVSLPKGRLPVPRGALTAVTTIYWTKSSTQASAATFPDAETAKAAAIDTALQLLRKNPSPPAHFEEGISWAMVAAEQFQRLTSALS